MLLAFVSLCYLQKFAQDCVDMVICNHIYDTVDELINHSNLFCNNTDASDKLNVDNSPDENSWCHLDFMLSAFGELAE